MTDTINRPGCKLLPELNQIQASFLKAAHLLFGHKPFTVAQFIEAVQKDPDFYKRFMDRADSGEINPVMAGTALFTVHRKLPDVMHAKLIKGNTKEYQITPGAVVEGTPWKNPERPSPRRNSRNGGVPMHIRIDNVERKVDALQQEVEAVNTRLSTIIQMLETVTAHTVPSGQRYAPPADAFKNFGEEEILVGGETE